MLRQETAMNVRKNFGDILNHVEYKHETILITRAGKASAAIVDIDLFNKIRKFSNKFNMLNEQLKDSFNSYAEDEINEIVNEAVKNVRNNT